ncbi:MAG TPA: MraY family glycosyltransferase [Crinalium sp.]|jgi:UDP-GlcNAc:undecaprenyl-phosphate GlcNAc-1-phosphate transferase
MIALTVLLVSLFTVLGITPLVRHLGLKFKLVDNPNERKIHRQPIVRVGGIAICLGTTAAAAVAWHLSENILPATEMVAAITILLGGVCFFAIGLADDVLNLHPLSRLALQGAVITIAWVLGLRIEFLPIPFVGVVSIGLLSLPITFLWMAGVANAINWLDGMDGLAAGVSTVGALVFAVVSLQASHPGIALVAIALAGATFGFLRYNANPARIFMGDGGSYFIGFILAGVGAAGLMGEVDFSSQAMPYIVLAVPILDMIFVILSRLLDQTSPFFPDQRHLHHRLLKLGASRQTTVWMIYGLMVWSGAGAIMLPFTPLGWLSVLITFITLGSTNPYLWKQIVQLMTRPFLLRRLIIQPSNPTAQDGLSD